jgi:hypothetical protein
MTGALDTVVRRCDGELARELLEAAGYHLVSRLAVPGYLMRSPEGVELDVILADNPWLDEALDCPRPDPAGYPVLDLPYLMLMKMDSSRGRHLRDPTTMLGLASHEGLDRVRAMTARYAPREAGDLQSLIYLVQVEMGKQPGPSS